MLVSDQLRFTFVHIPKCAGTSVRSALEQFVPEAGRYWGVGMIGDFGPVDLADIPLRVLADHLPETLEKIGTYDSYAVVRDPYDRFLSSVSEHFRNFESTRAELLPKRKLIRKLDRLLVDLRSNRSNQDPRLAHFIRQCDFIEFEGDRFVNYVYPISKLDHLFENLSAKIGKKIEIDQEKLRSRKLVKHHYAVTSAVGAARWIVDHTPLNRWRSRIKRGANSLLDPLKVDYSIDWLRELTFLDDFVQDYYLRDFELYRESLAFNNN